MMYAFSIDRLNRKRAAFASDWREIAGCFWILLMQLAKLLGHDKGDGAFPPLAFKEDDWEEEEAIAARQSIITEFAQTLTGLRGTYPQIPLEQEITQKLTPYFLRLAAIYGYFFREEDCPSDSAFDDEDAFMY